MGVVATKIKTQTALGDARGDLLSDAGSIPAASTRDELRRLHTFPIALLLL